MSNNKYIEHIVSLLSNKIEEIKDILTRSFLDSNELKTQVKIDLNSICKVYRIEKLDDEKFEKFYLIALKEVRHKYKHSMNPSLSLTSQNLNKTWLNDKLIAKIGWDNDEITTYRARYIEYLIKIGRPESYITETKRSSLEIVKKLGNPKNENDFFVRGLVVGSVQSGKTANFNAVINSAIDIGYDLIIVLSGIMEDLRVQTQKRIEKEVVGKYINGKFIGVGDPHSFGSLGQHNNVNQIIIPTSELSDFKKSMKEADFDLNQKNILVCKKNTGVLKNLILWLNDYLYENKDKIEIPFLIVDDEADNASLNNYGFKGKEYASTINGHIRALLALFKKKSYLGYTATPFANVLQDRNDESEVKWIITDKKDKKGFDQVSNLFPVDFIELLFPPSNYIGAKHYFETRYDEVKKIEPLIPTVVNDYTNSFPIRLDKDTEEPTLSTGKSTRAPKKDDVFPNDKYGIPDSLKEAIKCFVISTAIRISREKEMRQTKFFQPHNTMLIHISRFITWQTNTKKYVQDYVDELLSSLQNDSTKDKNGIYSEFEIIWYKYYAYVMENIENYLDEEYEDQFLISKTYKEIEPLLYKAISDVEVKAINSDTGDSLIYKDDAPKTYIAIGGNRLSRGFTLEGLTINYFVRNTNFADTLLQMGRWFGYRPGYIDCCKLFTTQDALDKFDQTTRTIEDLEQKFIEMNKDPNNAPSNYALRVLKHPGVLKLTRPNILKNTKEVNWSYSDHLIQTTKFDIDSKRIENAWKYFKEYFSKINSKLELIKNDNEKVEYIKYDIEKIDELVELLKLPNTFHDNSSKDEADYFMELIEYIKLCNESDKLNKWTIAIKVSGRGEIISKEDSLLPINIRKTVRSGFDPLNSKQTRWHCLLKNEKIFAAGGGSANILGGAQDMQIRLSKKQISDAIEEFKKDKFEEYKQKFPSITDAEIEEKMKDKDAPEKYFRKKMSEEEGVILIYLMDLESIFMHDKKETEELSELKNSVNTNTPLIGYAIGIPDIDQSIGGNYLVSIFHKENEEIEEIEEMPPELNDD